MKIKTLKPILVIPVATPAGVLAEIRAAGYIAILCDNPAWVKLITSSPTDIDGNMLLMSALFGMSGDGSRDERSRTLNELHRRLLAREKLVENPKGEKAKE